MKTSKCQQVGFRAYRLVAIRAGLTIAFAALAVGAGASSALAVGDATTAPGEVCPNESSPGFRSFLPECRGYEMVTPPYKQGYPVVSFSGYGNYTEAASPGEAPLYFGLSLGAFAGGPDDFGDEGNAFAFRRTEASWQARAVEPPLSEYVINTAAQGGSRTTIVVNDEGEALADMRRASESIFINDLYRLPSGGSPVLVGPMLPSDTIPVGSEANLQSNPIENEVISFADATEDLSHILYTIRPEPRQLYEERGAAATTGVWPGDTTLTGGAKSLYEYVGTGHSGVGGDAPALVGVNNSGELLSQCGITLGGGTGGQGNIRNAVSSSGEKVFFTATPGGCSGENPEGEMVVGQGPVVAELYARIGGRTTVPVSEPATTGPEASCVECKEGVPEAATFEGASSDGSKVYFSTAQELLPGASGTNLYEFNFDAPAGHRVSLVSKALAGAGEEQGVTAISSDGSHVYFVATGVLSGANAEGKQPAEGGEDPDNLYLALQECPGGGDTCAEPETHVTLIASLSPEDEEQWSRKGEGPMDVTPDGRFLVFTSYAHLTADDTSGEEAKQVFRYDAGTEQLVRVSIGNDGYDNDGNTDGSTHNFIPRPEYFGSEGAERLGHDSHPAVSDDGSIVVFQSSLALTPQAVHDPANVVRNVYEYRDGHVYLISDGHTTAIAENLPVYGSRIGGVSASGEDIFFETLGSLVPQDGDEEVDVYDARVDGGFPGPAAVADCEPQACQGSPPAAPAFGVPASATVAGDGNLAPATAISAPVKKSAAKKPAKCAKGKRRSHGKCVKRKPKDKRAKAKRSASGRKASR